MKNLYSFFAELVEQANEKLGRTRAGELFAEAAALPSVEAKIACYEKALKKKPKPAITEKHNGAIDNGSEIFSEADRGDLRFNADPEVFKTLTESFKIMLRGEGLSEEDLQLAAESAAGSETAGLKLRAKRGDRNAQTALMFQDILTEAER